VRHAAAGEQRYSDRLRGDERVREQTRLPDARRADYGQGAPAATAGVAHQPLDGGDLGTTLHQRIRHDHWIRLTLTHDCLTGENV
jgi:hypothetical protein